MESRADKFVYLDIDINSNRENYARAAAFVEANDIKYNFSSKVRYIFQMHRRIVYKHTDMLPFSYTLCLFYRISLSWVAENCCQFPTCTPWITIGPLRDPFPLHPNHVAVLLSNYLKRLAL